MRTPNTFDQMKNVSTKSMDKTISKVIKGWQTRYWIQHQIFMLLMISNTTWKFKNQMSILKTWVEVPLNHNEKWTFPYINWIQLLLRNIDWNESISKMAYKKKTGKMETQQINSASVGQPKCETNIKSKYLFHRLTRQVARWSVSFFPIPFRRLKYHSVSFRTLPPSSRGRCAGTLATNASVKTALWQPPEQTFENRFETFIRLMFQCEFEYSKILDFHFKYLILKVMKKKMFKFQ